MRALVIAVLVAVAAPAAAGPTAVEQAKARFKQGKAYQDVGQYERAAAEYKAAYELDRRPEMLFNVAQAYRLAAKKQDALDYFKRYLDAQPSGAGADEARKHVAALTMELEEEKRAQQAQPVEPPPVEKPLPVEPPPPVATVETRNSPTLRIAGLATAGAGVIALAVGVKFGLDARADADAISNKDMSAWTAEDKARFENGEAANRNMAIAYGVGGALVIGGAVMYFVGSRTQVTPVVAPQSAGLAVMGRF
ncbi:MAG TPA: tetratricopeptide repeat protein [Kofleriaceae bacterium]